MKLVTLVALSFFAFVNLEASSTDTIKIDAKNSSLQIGTLKIAKDSSISSVLAYLGKPSQTQKIAGKDRRFIFDDLGIALEADEAGIKIIGFTITFNWDDDKKVAKGKYTGVVLLDEYTFTENTTSNQVTENTSVKNLTCMGEAMCMTNPRLPGFTFLIGYQNSKVTQLGLGIK